jgi:hypothetical protein
VDDEYYDIARRVRDAAKKLERGINVLWAMCCGFTLVYILIGAYFKVAPMIIIGVVSMNTLLVTRTVIEVAEDIEEEIRKMRNLCRRGDSE